MRRLGFAGACVAAAVAGCGWGMAAWVAHGINEAIRHAWGGELPDWDDDSLAWCEAGPVPSDWWP